MFVQVIEGMVGDQEAIDRLMDRWRVEIEPGAVGFLGVTAGASTDGRSIAIVRFDSADSAAANAAREEQAAWWSEMEKAYDGSVTFTESSDVHVYLEPRSDAGFVQVMKGQTGDRERFEGMATTFIERLKELRPDVVGDVTIWLDEGRFIEVVYFTDEAAARQGEQLELPDDLAEYFAEFGETITDFLDLTEPTIR